MAKISRYKKRRSDRSGFPYYENEMVRDGPFLVGPDELDRPAPSKLPLGGEGDVSGEPRANSDFLTSGTANILPVTDHPTFFITAAGGITPDFNHAWMYVSGSNEAVNITADPQIVRGKEGELLSLLCVGSDITLDHGTGLNMMASANYLMTSGSYITFYYTTGGTVWNETNRGRL